MNDKFDDEFDEFQHTNVDCTSEDVHFLDEGDEQPTGEALASNEVATGDKNEIEVRFQP